MTNTTNDDTKGIVARTRIDFEIDVDAICAIARSSREWLVAHESGAEALTVLKEAKEELSSMLKEKKKKRSDTHRNKDNNDDNDNVSSSSSPYHEKVQEKIKSILPSDDMLNCLMKRGKYANFASAADAERIDEACEKLRRIVEEMESISKEMQETFETFTSSFENGGKGVAAAEEDDEKNPPRMQRDKEEEDDDEEKRRSRRGRDRKPRGRRRSRSRSEGRDRWRGRETEKDEEEKNENENDGEAVAKRLSFLETTTSTPTTYEAVKVHWMEKVPDEALSTKFSLSESGENKRSFEQWLFLCASALEGAREELRVKQVVAEKALDSLRAFNTHDSAHRNLEKDTKNGVNGVNGVNDDDDDVLLFDLLLDAWDVQAYADERSFRVLSESLL